MVETVEWEELAVTVVLEQQFAREETVAQEQTDEMEEMPDLAVA
jgi:hypothetical protein